jgi:hypothetical protein
MLYVKRVSPKIQITQVMRLTSEYGAGGGFLRAKKFDIAVGVALQSVSNIPATWTAEITISCG